MADIDVVIEICGSAGEGTISSGEILSRHMSGSGFEIMSFDAYPSEIRGFGKCIAHSRISTGKIYSPGKYADILIALNDAHAIPQMDTIKDGGIVIFDEKPARYLEEDQSIAGWIRPGMIPYGIPLLELAQKATGMSRSRNLVALGALCALFHIDMEGFKSSIEKRYAKLSRSIIDGNVDSFMEGFEWASRNVPKIDAISFKDGPRETGETSKIIINGNQAVAKAALDSDIHLYAGYPITPATKIMEILSAELPKKGGVLIQTEDEISAIGNVIGAGFAGKRAMTATSGPGFCLMSEFTGLSIMAEVPAVIINSQRGGPSTGLPTKPEQSDLNITLYGGHGDAPRFVIAPSTVEECYTGTAWAFYLAEKYQTLAIVLMDFFLSNSIKNIDMPTLPGEKFLNSNVYPDKEEFADYKRYLFTESGISPRTIPGTPGGMFFSTGLEHDERGTPSYSGENHKAMTEKRFRKLEHALKEIPEPIWSGLTKDVDVGVISWGSSAGSAHEAVAQANRAGIKAAAMSPLFLSPLHNDHINRFSNACKKILVPELNYSGQFANYIAGDVHQKIERLNMVSALPMASEDILDKIKQMA